MALLFYRIWESLGFSVTLNRYQGISLFEQDQVKACDSEGVNLMFLNHSIVNRINLLNIDPSAQEPPPPTPNPSEHPFPVVGHIFL